MHLTELKLEAGHGASLRYPRVILHLYQVVFWEAEPARCRVCGHACIRVIEKLGKLFILPIDVKAWHQVDSFHSKLEYTLAVLIAHIFHTKTNYVVLNVCNCAILVHIKHCRYKILTRHLIKIFRIIRLQDVVLFNRVVKIVAKKYAPPLC